MVEGAVDAADGEEGWDVEFVGGVGGVEDEVEGELPLFGPVFRGGGDEVFGAEFESVVFFRGGVRDDVDFGAEGFGPKDSEVAEAAEADDGDLFTWSNFGAPEGREGGEASAHHWGGLDGGNVVGDWEGEVFVGTDVG